MFMFMMFVVLKSNAKVPFLNAGAMEGLTEFAQKQWHNMLFNNLWGSSFV